MKKTFNKEKISQKEWADIISQLPNPHFLQTAAWAEIKSSVGWTPTALVWRGSDQSIVAGVNILERKIKVPLLPLKISILYAPKGPLLDWDHKELRNEVLADLETYARENKSILLKIDPDVVVTTAADDQENFTDNETGKKIIQELRSRKWQFSTDQIQFRNTVYLSLSKSEAEILASMKQKTRYNIRLAERKGVKIRNATKKELGQIYEMYARTSLRDGFTIRSKDYYLMVWEKFMDAGMCEILIAEVEQQMVAGLVLFLFEDKAYYVYGMSGELYRNYMPTYLLQYEAIKRAKSRGCNVYDLWGAPDNFSKSDPMWGVFRFKKGLGGEVVSTLGAWDFPVRPLQMKLFQIILPKILEKMRKIGNRKTSESVSSL